MYPFTYVRPSTLSEASVLLEQEEDARPLSGGMTLIPTLKQRLAAPSCLVDLSHLQELQGISVAGHVLHIGAATRHVEVATSPLVAQAIPALASLAGVIADPQVRNRGTMGGSVANNDPAADYPAAVLGLAAVVVTNQRRIPAGAFFVDMFETALAPAEIIVSFELPIPHRAAYSKLRHKATGYAVAGVFVADTQEGVRVAVTGAGPSVFRWQQAEAILTQDCRSSALDGAGMDTAQFVSDANGSAEYRAHLVKVMTRRAVESLVPPQ